MTRAQNSSDFYSYLKVILKSPKQELGAYTKLPSNWNSFLLEVQGLFPKEDINRFRKYWIDVEEDKIDVFDDASYNMFLQLENIQPGNRTIYITSVVKDKETANVNVIHDRVSCDSCNAFPIVGFRYKCVQCPNFDLCGKCEGENVHNEHVMFRFPAPIKSIPFNKHFLKRMKNGCFIHPEEGGITRRSRRFRGRPCHNNIFSSLYDMMSDMAEGAEAPTADCDDSAHSDVDDENIEKKKKESSGHRKCQRHSAPAFDPSYLKTGVEILGNFSEMFSKIINPANITANTVPETNISENKNSKDNENETNVIADKKATSENIAKNVEPNNEIDSNAEKIKDINLNGKIGNKITAVKVDQSSTSKQTGMPDKDEFDWTVINPPSNSARSGSANSAHSESVQKNGQQSPSREEGATANYFKLSQDLYDHMQKEGHMTPAVNAQPAQKVDAAVDSRGMIVYHKDHRINNAVYAMMGMGFSNEGNWLTYLLESVNGDIAQAIDLMKPVK